MWIWMLATSCMYSKTLSSNREECPAESNTPGYLIISQILVVFLVGIKQKIGFSSQNTQAWPGLHHQIEGQNFITSKLQCQKLCANIILKTPFCLLKFLFLFHMTCILQSITPAFCSHLQIETLFKKIDTYPNLRLFYLIIFHLCIFLLFSSF